MRMTRYLSIIGSLLFLGLNSMAQDCDSPTQLCYIQFDNLMSDSTMGGPINGVSNGCFEANSASMFSIETIAAGELVVQLSQVICDSLGNSNFGDSLQVLLFTATDPCDPLSYVELDCTEGLGILQLETLSADSGLTYHVIVSGQLGDLFPAQCGYNIQIDGPAVETDLNVTPYFLINQGETVTLEASGASEYLWSPAFSLDFDTVAMPTAFPQSSTLYTLEAQVGSCTQTFEVFVEVIPGIIPVNLFTPNGDGLNETWRIFAIERFPNADVRVFSRWGQLVFRSTGYGNGREWDGTNGGGTRLPEGTYYYVIDLNLPGLDSDPVTGSVAITY